MDLKKEKEQQQVINTNKIEQKQGQEEKNLQKEELKKSKKQLEQERKEAAYKAEVDKACRKVWIRNMAMSLIDWSDGIAPELGAVVSLPVSIGNHADVINDPEIKAMMKKEIAGEGLTDDELINIKTLEEADLIDEIIMEAKFLMREYKFSEWDDDDKEFIINQTESGDRELSERAKKVRKNRSEMMKKAVSSLEKKKGKLSALELKMIVTLPLDKQEQILKKRGLTMKEKEEEYKKVSELNEIQYEQMPKEEREKFELDLFLRGYVGEEDYLKYPVKISDYEENELLKINLANVADDNGIGIKAWMAAKKITEEQAKELSQEKTEGRVKFFYDLYKKIKAQEKETKPKDEKKDLINKDISIVKSYKMERLDDPIMVYLDRIDELGLDKKSVQEAHDALFDLKNLSLEFNEIASREIEMDPNNMTEYREKISEQPVVLAEMSGQSERIISSLYRTLGKNIGFTKEVVDIRRELEEQNEMPKKALEIKRRASAILYGLDRKNGFDPEEENASAEENLADEENLTAGDEQLKEKEDKDKEKDKESQKKNEEEKKRKEKEEKEKKEREEKEKKNKEKEKKDKEKEKKDKEKEKEDKEKEKEDKEKEKEDKEKEKEAEKEEEKDKKDQEEESEVEKEKKAQLKAATEKLARDFKRHVKNVRRQKGEETEKAEREREKHFATLNYKHISYNEDVYADNLLERKLQESTLYIVGDKRRYDNGAMGKGTLDRAEFARQINSIEGIENKIAVYISKLTNNRLINYLIANVNNISKDFDARNYITEKLLDRRQTVVERSADSEEGLLDITPEEQSEALKALSDAESSRVKVEASNQTEKLIKTIDNKMDLLFAKRTIMGIGQMTPFRKKYFSDLIDEKIETLPDVEQPFIFLPGVEQVEFQGGAECWADTTSNLLRYAGHDVRIADVKSYGIRKNYHGEPNFFEQNINSYNDISDYVDYILGKAYGYSLEEKGISCSTQDDCGLTIDEQVLLFKESVVNALRENTPIGIGYSKHYQTVVGIDGDNLILKNPLTNDEGDLNQLTIKSITDIVGRSAIQTREAKMTKNGADSTGMVKLFRLKKIEYTDEAKTKVKISGQNQVSYDEKNVAVVTGEPIQLRPHQMHSVAVTDSLRAVTSYYPKVKME